MENLYPIVDAQKTGDRIQYLMRKNNISPKQLQEYLGLSCVQSIYRWLNGINIPTVDNLYAMSVLFNTSVDGIICGNRENVIFMEERYKRLKLYYTFLTSSRVASA